MADACEGTDGGELRRPLLGQHRHRDRTGLHHGEPAGREPGCGGSAQQHPVAGNDAQIVRQHLGDPVHPVPQIPVAPDSAVGGPEGGAAGAEAGGGAVEQLVAAVQPVRVGQFGKVEDQLRPVLGGREVVAREGVRVRARGT